MKIIKEILKFAGAFTLCFIVIIGASFIVMALTQNVPIKLAATGDYIKHQQDALDIKIEAMKDSCLTNVNNTKVYNNYVDSVKKYTYIYNYFNHPLK